MPYYFNGYSDKSLPLHYYVVTNGWYWCQAIRHNSNGWCHSVKTIVVYYGGVFIAMRDYIVASSNFIVNDINIVNDIHNGVVIIAIINVTQLFIVIVIF